MPLKINDIIEALKDATPRERRKLGEALQKTGISLGKRDRPGLTRRTAQSVGVPTSREELGEAAEGKLQAGAQNAMDAARKALSSEGFQSLGTVADDIADSIGRMYDESQKFVEAGYTGQMYFDFTKAISAANKASLDLTGGFVAGDLALEAFRESSKAFALTTVGMQENLLRTGVALAATGFNMTDFAEIVEESAFAFNQNQEQIEQLTSTLIEVQREIPVASTELAKNFRFAQQNFAYSADQMMDTFIGLQKLSTSTGVGFDSLADSFGESMDSFEGSATKAGTLNQILGKSVFNSMELLTMTEEERANTIRDRIMESGRSIEDMGKFELRALAQGMGMSISDTRKFLRGDLAVDAGDFMKKVEAQDPTELKTKKLEDSVGRLTKTYLSNLRPMDQLTLQMRKLSRGFLIESAKYSDGIKEMMEKNFTMEQALSQNHHRGGHGCNWP